MPRWLPNEETLVIRWHLFNRRGRQPQTSKVLVRGSEILDHEIERPERRLPAESVVLAVSCTAAPASRLTTAGVTFTEATAAGTTVTVVVSEAEELPWPWATIWKWPESRVAL